MTLAQDPPRPPLTALYYGEVGWGGTEGGEAYLISVLPGEYERGRSQMALGRHQKEEK